MVRDVDESVLEEEERKHKAALDVMRSQLDVMLGKMALLEAQLAETIEEKEARVAELLSQLQEGQTSDHPNSPNVPLTAATKAGGEGTAAVSPSLEACAQADARAEAVAIQAEVVELRAAQSAAEEASDQLLSNLVGGEVGDDGEVVEAVEEAVPAVGAAPLNGGEAPTSGNSDLPNPALATPRPFGRRRSSAGGGGSRSPSGSIRRSGSILRRGSSCSSAGRSGSVERLSLVRENELLRAKLRALEVSNTDLAHETEAGQAQAEATQEYLRMMAAAEVFEKEVLLGGGEGGDSPTGGDGSVGRGGYSASRRDESEDKADARRFSRLDLLFATQSPRSGASSPDGNLTASSSPSKSPSNDRTSETPRGFSDGRRSSSTMSFSRGRGGHEVAQAAEAFSRDVGEAVRGFSEAASRSGTRSASLDRSAVSFSSFSLPGPPCPSSAPSRHSGTRSISLEDDARNESPSFLSSTTTTTTSASAIAAPRATRGGRWTSPTWFIPGWDKPSEELAAKLAKRTSPNRNLSTDMSTESNNAERLGSFELAAVPKKPAARMTTSDEKQASLRTRPKPAADIIR